MSKADWSRRGFWIVVPTLLIAAGMGLREFGHPVAGRRTFYAGVALAALFILGALLEWAARPIVAAANPIWRTGLHAVRFVANSIAWLGGLLLAPVIRQVLSQQNLGQEVRESKEAMPNSWTAFRPLTRDGADFLHIIREGHRLAGGCILVRSETVTNWHAGIRLACRGKLIPQARDGAKALLHLSPTMLGRDGYAFELLGAVHGPWNLQLYNIAYPSHRIDFTVSRREGNNSLTFGFRINQEAPLEFAIPSDAADELVLLGWGNGHPFLVHFEILGLSWTATDV